MGMYANKVEKNMNINDLLALKNHDNPIIQDDSTSGFMHTATVKYGLTIGDIHKMKFGDRMEIVFFDRNVGAYTSDLKQSSFNPAKVGFSYGTYIHGKGLKGMLNFDDIGDFTI